MLDVQYYPMLFWPGSEDLNKIVPSTKVMGSYICIDQIFHSSSSGIEEGISLDRHSSSSCISSSPLSTHVPNRLLKSRHELSLKPSLAMPCNWNFFSFFEILHPPQTNKKADCQDFLPETLSSQSFMALMI